jgi:hypothetical protein
VLRRLSGLLEGRRGGWIGGVVLSKEPSGQGKEVFWVFDNLGGFLGAFGILFPPIFLSPTMSMFTPSFFLEVYYLVHFFILFVSCFIPININTIIKTIQC